MEGMKIVPGGKKGGGLMSMREASISIMPFDSSLGAEDFDGRVIVSWLVCGVGGRGNQKVLKHSTSPHLKATPPPVPP